MDNSPPSAAPSDKSYSISLYMKNLRLSIPLKLSRRFPRERKRKVVETRTGSRAGAILFIAMIEAKIGIYYVRVIC